MRRPRSTTRTAAALCLALVVGSGVGGCASRGSSSSSTGALAEVPALHRALPASVRSSGVLRIATDASYAPASSFAADGRTIVGFEPDLGRALGQVLGVQVVFSDHSFDSLPAMVAGHRTDLVMSAMTDTVAREEQVDFVDYFTAGSSIVVQRGDPQGIYDLRDLCGRTVALQRGTVQVDLLASVQAGCGARPATVELYDTNTDALLQVRTGRADAVLTDYPPAAALVADPRTRSSYQLASTAQYSPSPYGIAVAKDRPQLRGAVAKALVRVQRSGRYKAVLARWGVSSGALARISVNGGATS